MTAQLQLRLSPNPGSFDQRHGVERWPLADLLDAAAIAPDGPTWAAEAALRFRVSRRTVHHWRNHGLTTAAADDAAIRARTHPVLVWSTWDRCDGDGVATWTVD